MDSLWVLILLLFAFCTIVTVRMFQNGAREDAEAALEAPSPAESADVPSAAPPTNVATRARGRTPATIAATATPAELSTPTTARRSRRAAVSKAAAPPAAWTGGDCPNCGSRTVPSAKFCGECGHRLVP